MTRSRFEGRLEQQLLRSGVPFSYESLKIPYTLSYNYIPDFVYKNGIIIEGKGYLDSDSRAKMLAVKKQHPDLDIRFVFMDGDNTISKQSTTTYMDWAKKHGFPAAHGEIPTEWLDEGKDVK